MTVNGQTTTFTYDGNGALVKKVAPGSVTYYVGSHYEVQIDAPAAPSGLGATALSTSQIRLTWTDNSDNETGFRIERSATGTSGWSQIGTVAANVTTYTNSNLTCGTRYYYRVRAYNVAGTSAYSNVANAQTLACSSIPAAPSNLSAVVTYGHVVHLSWIDNSDNEDGFEISRCVGIKPGMCEEFRLAGPDRTAYEDWPCGGGVGLSAEAMPRGENAEPAVIPGVLRLYTYCVRAYNQTGESACSNTVPATVICPLSLSGAETALDGPAQATEGTSSPDGGLQMATGDSTASASATEEGVGTTSPDTVLIEDAGAVLDEGEMVILSSAGQTERSYYYFGGVIEAAEAG